MMPGFGKPVEVLPKESGRSPEIREIGLGDQSLEGMVLLQGQGGLITITRAGEDDDGGGRQRDGKS